MPKANIGDAELYYEVHGEGTPLLLVSGLGGTAAYWKPNLAAFAAKYRTVVHDHRGAGQSTHSRMRYSVDQMTDDVLRLMDHLKIERAHLVGHSTGGAIGQTMAATRPERLASLTLFSTWTRADAYFRRLFELRRAVLTKIGAEQYTRAGTLFLYPDWWIVANEKMLAEREALTVKGFAPVEVVASRIDAIVAFDRSQDLAKIKTPTLVVCAKDDLVTPAYFSEELAQKIAGAQFVLLPKGGHCASESVPELFNIPVLAFLAAHKL